ncbi:MAG: hypothetical protein PHW40_07040 [Candidatus Izemoplasmatales bacterium]|nr:hypothetical protein [Candidatus Izemoplasmatales bacterium]MDD5294041.1 hypothetical protein [Candidatus Izemoplasmatales bacterium]
MAHIFVHLGRKHDITDQDGTEWFKKCQQMIDHSDPFLHVEVMHGISRHDEIIAFMPKRFGNTQSEIVMGHLGLRKF